MALHDGWGPKRSNRSFGTLDSSPSITFDKIRMIDDVCDLVYSAVCNTGFIK
jgi:hypothetical protein